MSVPRPVLVCLAHSTRPHSHPGLGFLTQAGAGLGAEALPGSLLTTLPCGAVQLEHKSSVCPITAFSVTISSMASDDFYTPYTKISSLKRVVPSAGISVTACGVTRVILLLLL